MDDSIVSPARIHQHRCNTVLVYPFYRPPLRGDLPGTDTSIPWDMIFQDLNYDFAAQNCTLELTLNCRTGSKFYRNFVGLPSWEYSAHGRIKT